MTQQDAELERQIDRAFMLLQHASTPHTRSRALAHMESLIAQRSPARIKEMERERGFIDG
jgi:hypothetical protein